MALYEEVVNLTVREYGCIDVRTQGIRPVNNTPLMMLAKSQFPEYIEEYHYVEMISIMLAVGRADPASVDNRFTNGLDDLRGAWHARVFQLLLRTR